MRKGKFTYILLASLLISSSLYASEIILPMPTIEDTFTHKNVDDIFFADSSMKMFITSDNTVKLKGNTNWGTGGQDSKIDFVNIVSDDVGSYLGDIIKLDSTIATSNGDKNYVFLNSDGKVYVVKGKTSKAVKLELGSLKIVDIVAGDLLYLLDDEGNVYTSAFTNELMHINPNGPQFRQIEPLNTGSIVAIGVATNNNMYTLSKDAIRFRVSGVEEVYSGISKIHYALFKSVNGKLLYKDFYSNSNPVLPVLPNDVEFYSVASSKNSSLALINTSDGLYSWNGTSASSKLAIQPDFKPVTMSYSHVLGDNNKIYNFSGITDSVTFKLNSDNNLTQSWMNENPIVDDYVLANFDIEQNKIFSRNTTKEIKFSIITQVEPKAFNIFYAKNGDMGNRDKWVEIESNISYDSLNPVDYNTGYTDNMGNDIMGKTYTYNWKIGNENLTNIQLIAEPIY